MGAAAGAGISFFWGVAASVELTRSGKRFAMQLSVIWQRCAYPRQWFWSMTWHDISGWLLCRA